MNQRSLWSLAAFFCAISIVSAQTGPTGPWQLTFSDEFNGTSLDTTKWNTQYSWGCHNNDEQECYQAANVTVSGGVAHLTAKQQTVTSGGSTYNYTSGMIQNSKAFSQTYGYFEMRAKVPKGQGFWPAFWTLPSNGNWPPEIDTIEIGKGGDFTTARMTLHWGTNGNDNYQENDWSSTDFSQAFHVYAVDWEAGKVTWYIDGVQRAQMVTSNSPTVPMYLLANLAVGGSWPGNVNSSTPLPSNMDIDYIRAWTKSSSGCYTTVPGPTDAIPTSTCSGTPTDTQPPTVPTTLTASAVSSSQINLSWTASTDNVGVAGYRIYRNGSQVGTATGTTYQDTGLAASTTYSYTVSAYDAAGDSSAQSSPVSATTSAAGVTSSAPAITSFVTSPSSITAGQSATLSWAVTGTPTPSLTVNGTAVTGSSVTVSPSQTTTYTLAASNSAGSTSAQTTVSVSAGSTTSSSGTTQTSSAAPVIFFTDLESGPNTGGENNNGAYVTIYGNNFGTSPTVTVGGGQALIKLAPSSYLWYQRMSIQLGANATTGNIVVSNSSGTSNGVPFTVRAGKIYFVSTSGSDSNAGTVSAPFATLPKARNTMAPGDITYMRGGTWSAVDNFSAVVNIFPEDSGTTGNPKAFVGYPGETAACTTTTDRCFSFQGHTGDKTTPLHDWVVAEVTVNSYAYPMYMASGYGPVNNIRWIALNAVQHSNASALDTERPGSTWRFYGNLVDGTGDGSSKAYAIYIGGGFGNGPVSDVDIGWNQLSRSKRGKGVQAYGHMTGDTLSGLKVHDNLVFGNCMSGLEIGGSDANVPFIQDATIWNNVLYNNGGCDPTSTAYWGMEIHNQNSTGAHGGTFLIYNNTFYQNGAPSLNGGGELDINELPQSVVLKNNVFYTYASGTLGYIDWEGTNPQANVSGSNNVWFNRGSGPSQTSANITQDPLFVNAAGSDFHLQATSPAKDAGVTVATVTRDHDGILRPQGSGYDIGAYEYFQGTGTPPPASPCDINGDGSVTPADANLLMTQLLSPTGCTTDLNGDGKCNVVDLQRAINAANGQTCRLGQ
jgi:beta-glucanase (GH16 family)